MAKQTVQDIVVERLIEKINSEKRLPWQKPFQTSCMNWFSNREYRGINKILLDGGEYITPKQIEQYNASKKTRFWFEKGTPSEIVVFYSRIEKKISDKEATDILKKPGGHRVVQPSDNGWVKITWLLKYYRVYNIKFIRDIVNEDVKNNPEFKEGVYKKREIETKKGPKLILDLKNGQPQLKDGVSESDIALLEAKIGKSIIEEHTPADKIVDFYTKSSGVRLLDSGSGAYYTHVTDAVHLPPKSNFANTEAYYRVLFHELIHSTGIEKRLNRQCFRDYHDTNIERSKEELIAEVGSLLLASEAGFRDDSEWVENSENYIAGWCSWMRDNKAELLNGLLASEKATSYILSGGVKADAGSERSIDNPNEKVEDSDVDTEADSFTPPTDTTDTPSTDTVEDKPVKKSIKSLKSKKAVKEYYDEHLAKYFNQATTEDEQKDILLGIKGDELKHMYKVLTKEEMPKVKKKADALALVRQCIEKSTQVG